MTRQGYNTKVVVASLVLPWSQPFSQPAHTWVRAVPAAQAYQGLGLVDGESSKVPPLSRAPRCSCVDCLAWLALLVCLLSGRGPLRCPAL